MKRTKLTGGFQFSLFQFCRLERAFRLSAFTGISPAPDESLGPSRSAY